MRKIQKKVAVDFKYRSDVQAWPHAKNGVNDIFWATLIYKCAGKRQNNPLLPAKFVNIVTD